MEWDRYYKETNITPFNEQAPYYAYFLDHYKEFVTRGKDPNKPLSVALGGLHPKVTLPSHFASLCQAVFDSPLDVHIIEQNKQVLDSLPQADEYSLLHAQLEALPEHFPQLSLLICDFTLDFMSDSQVKELNKTLPAKLDTNGLFIVTQECTAIPIITKLQNKIKYGIDVHPRSADNLCNLLPNE